MIAVIIGVFVTIASLMVAFFLAVSNVSFIVENDFMTKVKQNAIMHALGVGQLAVRSKALKVNSSAIINPGYVRDFNDGTFNNMTYNVSYKNGTINVDIEVK